MITARLGWIAPLSFACALGACSSHPRAASTEPADPGPAPTTGATSPPSTPPAPPANDAGTGACDLTAEGISFATPACTTCMQTSCCAVTVTCVITDQQCASLQQCLLDCPKPGSGAGGNGDGGGGGSETGGGGGDGGGNGTGGGDGGGNGTGGGGTGAGAQACHDACMAKYTSAQADQKAYNDCVTGPCATSCM